MKAARATVRRVHGDLDGRAPYIGLRRTSVQKAPSQLNGVTSLLVSHGVQIARALCEGPPVGANLVAANATGRCASF